MGKQSTTDAVKSPAHYLQGYIEAIYVIEQVLGKEGFKAYCMGNYLKYNMRAEHKNGQEDKAKADVYLGWATNGLPLPVDGRIPQNEYSESTLAFVLQNTLDRLVAGTWKVKAVRVGCVEVEASLEHASGAVWGIGPIPYVEGERYFETAERLIEEYKKVFPKGPRE